MSNWGAPDPWWLPLFINGWSGMEKAREDQRMEDAFGARMDRLKEEGCRRAEKEERNAHRADCQELFRNRGRHAPR